MKDYNMGNFIDSDAIRKFNESTKFSPAERAVLISYSRKRTMGEKLKALRYLTEIYSEQEFVQYKGRSFREIVEGTIRVWEKALQDRKSNEGVIYAAVLCEKNCIRNSMTDYHFFSSYAKAFEWIKGEKQYYLSDEKLKGLQTFGEIRRIKVDDDFHEADIYHFDNEMRLVDMAVSYRRLEKEGITLLDGYEIYIPLPFKAGDLVKCTSPFYKTCYGVFSSEWKRPESSLSVCMYTSLDIYDAEDDDFDFTDGTFILDLEFAEEEELPEDQKVLKLISAVRKGKQDFYSVLHCYGRGSMDQLLHNQF